MLRLLLEHRPDAIQTIKNQQGKRHPPILQYALHRNENEKKPEENDIFNKEMMKFCIEHGANIDFIVKRSPSKDTLLHKSVRTNNGSLVKLLVENGVDPNVKNAVMCFSLL